MYKSNYKNNDFCGGESAVRYSPVGSLAQRMQSVRQQIEVDCFPIRDKALAEELAIIIAEVFLLNPDSEISIAGEKLPAHLVQEVYARLEHEHVRTVISHFRRATYRIIHTKAYMRTALYNSVFEFEAQTENEVMVDMPYLAEEV